MNTLFNSILTSESTQMSLNLKQMLLMFATSALVGYVIVKVHAYRNHSSKYFLMTVALLPALVAAIIMVVNGNLGAGITVAGAFSLVRFRSAPGNAREITTIFFAMAAGLAIGMGYITYAIGFTIFVGALIMVYTTFHFGENGSQEKLIKITLPEDVDYNTAFTAIFDEFLESAKFDRVKTTNLGSLIEVSYIIRQTDPENEKMFIDKLREHNGNLPIVLEQAGRGGYNDL